VSGRPGQPGRGSEDRILRAVDPSDEGVPSSEALDRRGWLGIGLLVLILVAVVVAYAVERDRSAALAAEVGKLESQLATAQSEVKAYELRIANVSDAVEELSNRLDELQSLVLQPVEASPAAVQEPATP